MVTKETMELERAMFFYGVAHENMLKYMIDMILVRDGLPEFNNESKDDIRKVYDQSVAEINAGFERWKYCMEEFLMRRTVYGPDTKE